MRRLLVLLPTAAQASPINYDALSDPQLGAMVILSVVLILALGTIGLIGWLRYRRQHRRTGQGPAPVLVLVGVLAIAVTITGLFILSSRG